MLNSLFARSAKRKFFGKKTQNFPFFRTELMGIPFSRAARNEKKYVKKAIISPLATPNWCDQPGTQRTAPESARSRERPRERAPSGAEALGSGRPRTPSGANALGSGRPGERKPSGADALGSERPRERASAPEGTRSRGRALPREFAPRGRPLPRALAPESL